MNHFRGIILSSMARTLWVTAYADEVDERAVDSKLSAEDRQKARDAQARNGADWMDVAPETPEAARAMAAKLCEVVERTNSRFIEDGFITALVADWMNETNPQPKAGNGLADDFADQLADQFGHYLVMEAMGHGVSWEDDHAEMPLKLPHGFENYELRDEVKL